MSAALTRRFIAGADPADVSAATLAAVRAARLKVLAPLALPATAALAGLGIVAFGHDPIALWILAGLALVVMVGAIVLSVRARRGCH